jgi:hypothetical protein
MPISNNSQIWPKILICKECKQAVERGTREEYAVGRNVYSCPGCDSSVPSANTQWIEEIPGH